MAATERRPSGLLDPSVVIDLLDIPVEQLPMRSFMSAVTLAEVSQRPHFTRSAIERARRFEVLQVVESRFPAPSAFDARAARRYGTLVSTVVAAGRSRKPRKPALMIAAIAAMNGLPLFTRDPVACEGLGDLVEVVAV